MRYSGKAITVTCRRHGALKEITEAGKWAQCLAGSPIRQANVVLHQESSRLPDFCKWITGQQLYTNLDKPHEPDDLNLGDEQEQDSLVANLFNKNIQLSGG